MPTINFIHRACLLVAVLLLASCASLVPPLQNPEISVNAFRLLPSRSLSPEFAIDLHVVNPNSRELGLRGIAYSASIEGYRIISGASNQLPVVAAYGEADITLHARADMMGGLRLINDLMATRREQLKFELSIKLDVGSLLPNLHITESGTISLAPEQSGGADR